MKTRKHTLKRLMATALSAAMLLCVPVQAMGENAGAKFYSDYETMDGALNAAHALNEQIAAEGYVLIKNDNSLPLAVNSKINLFTASKSTGVAAELARAGFEVNDLYAQAANDFATDENGKAVVPGGVTGCIPIDSYSDELLSAMGNFSDTAVVVFQRSGGEGSDNRRESFTVSPTREDIESGEWTPEGIPGRESDPFQHYQELDDNERALLAMLQENDAIQNIVVLLDSTYAMEVGFLKDASLSKVRSCIWMTGNGANAYAPVGDLLSGAINPSGRTPDILQADFTADPSWQNFAYNLLSGSGFDAATGDQYTLEDGMLYKDAFDLGYYGVEYQEGIYIGYRYYETRGCTDGEDWYAKYVNYPFGYGLSYTNFAWEVEAAGGELAQDGVVTVNVKVTNTGSVAGKDVVQLYYEAPYTVGGIEKSVVELADFAKTGLLQPGQSETVTLTVNARDMASYDAYDANKNGFKGYELDGGVYKLYVSKDSHSWASAETVCIECTVPTDGYQYATDEATGHEIANRFDYINEELQGQTLSRADWDGTFPTRPYWFDVEDDCTIDPYWAAWYRTQHDGEDWDESDTTVEPVYLKEGPARLVKDEEWLANFEMPLNDKDNSLNGGNNNFVIDPAYDENNARYGGQAPWYSETAPSFRADAEAYSAENPAPIQLADMTGVAFDDAKWDEYLSQFTVKEAVGQLITAFNFIPDEAMGIPNSTHGDGPFGIQEAFAMIRYLQPGDMMDSDTILKWCSQVTVGASFNKDLAYQYGVINGDLGLWYKFTGWYSPGANTHRTPFSGRNNNYVSEDPFLSGTVVAQMCRGCREKGMITFVKHYALNDQETHRDVTGVATWADEQTMRQIYLKVFEMAVKEGGTLGMMTSFNRVGFDWAGASYELLTEIARDEWGFEGIYITDAAGTDQAGNYMNANMMLRAGQDTSLDGVAGGYFWQQDETGIPTRVTGISSNEESLTATHLTAIYNCLKRTQYILANSPVLLNNHTYHNPGYDQSEFAKAIDNSVDMKYFGRDTAEALAKIKVFEVEAGQEVAISVADPDLAGQDFIYVLYQGDLCGLTLNRATGEITGTLSADVAPGNHRFTIGLCDSDIAQGEEWTASVINYFYLQVK